MSAAAPRTTADGWTVVASRRSAPRPEAPPAFGRPAFSSPAFGSGGRANSTPENRWGSRPEAPAAFAGSRPRPAPQVNHGTALRAERTAEATRAAALDFASTEAYPSLGAPGRARPAASTRASASAPSALDFRGAAAAAVAREDAASASASAAADAYEEEYARRRRERLAAAEAERARRARLALIGTRCHDDGPEDYDGPEENDADYVPEGTGTTDDWADTDGLHDASGGDAYTATRRRGDKGVW